MSVLSTGQEYNASLVPKMKQKASDFASDKIKGVKVGGAMFASEVVGEVLGDTIGNLVGGFLMPKEKKETVKTEQKQEKLQVGDYFKIMQSELGSLFKKTTATEIQQEDKKAKKEKLSKESKTAPVQKEDVEQTTKAVGESSELLKRVANATEVTENASVEQVDILDKIAKSMGDIDKKTPTKGEREEAEFEQIKKKEKPNGPSIAPLTKEKGLLDTVMGFFDGFKGLSSLMGGFTKALSGAASLLGTLGPLVLPIAGIAAAIYGASKLVDLFEEKMLNNSKEQLKEGGMIDTAQKLAGGRGTKPDAEKTDKELIDDKYTIGTFDFGKKERLLQEVKGKMDRGTEFSEYEVKKINETIGDKLSPEEKQQLQSLTKPSLSQVNQTPAVEPLNKSFQQETSAGLEANTNKYSENKDKKAAAQPIMINSPTTNNNTTTSSQGNPQYSPNTSEPTFRRLQDKLMYTAIV